VSQVQAILQDYQWTTSNGAPPGSRATRQRRPGHGRRRLADARDGGIGDGLHSDWSRSEREFQLRVDNCRRCIEGGVPNAAWCTCVLGLIADLGGQAAAARDLAVSVEAASQLDQRWMANRLFAATTPRSTPTR